MTAEKRRSNPHRKPPSQSFDSFIEERIRNAIDNGEFQGLPGLGKPIPDIDLPYDENRWLRDKLKREKVNAVPPLLQIKLDIEATLEKLNSLESEAAARKLLAELNERILAASYAHIAGPTSDIMALDIEKQIYKWKAAT